MGKYQQVESLKNGKIFLVLLEHFVLSRQYQKRGCFIDGLL